MARLLVSPPIGDPILAVLKHENKIYTGTASGKVTAWDERFSGADGSSAAADGIHTNLAPWCEEGIRGLCYVNERVHAVIGDLCVMAWKEGEEKHRFDFQRQHNISICNTSFPILGDSNKVLVLTQGQAYSHFLDLNTRRQQSLATLGCPWYTIPCHYRGDELLWREMLTGPDTCFLRGKTGDVQRLRIWDVSDPASVQVTTTLTVKSSGGFRLWGNRVAAFRGRKIRLYDKETGAGVLDLVGHNHVVKSIEVSETFAVSVGEDGSVRWWGEDGRGTDVVHLPRGWSRCYSADMTQLRIVDDKNVLVCTGDAVYMATR